MESSGKMKLFALLFLNPIILCQLTLAEEHLKTSMEMPAMEEWLDPGDMIGYDPERTSANRGFPKTGPNGESKPTDCGMVQGKLSQCQKDLEKMPQQCQPCSEKTVINVSSCDTPYFKKVARTLLGNIEDRGDHDVIITVSKDDEATLEKFVSSGDGNVHDVCEVIIAVVSNFKGKDQFYDFGQWDTSFAFGFITKEALFILVALIFVICAAVIFEKQTNLTWRSQLWFVMFLSFIVSIPWEWYHLYRKSFATKQAEMEKDIPKECRPDDQLQPFDYVKLWLKSAFTFSYDPCVKYQERLLVDPMWEVSPSRAISATLASIIAQPFEHVAEAIGKSFRALFREVPIQWQPFMFFAVIVIIIIGMFILSGLQVKLPFITITTVPAVPGNIHADLQQLMNQVQNVGEVLQQMNEAAGERDAIEHDRQRQVIALLNALNQGQLREAQPAEQRALCPVEVGANDAGSEEERRPVMETGKVKVPVQSSDENSVFGVESVGTNSEES